MAKFVGRTEELQWLREEFERVVQDKKPRISVILGDPGQGKTRLVQELYQQLASDPEWDPEDVDFWPPMYQSRDGDKAKHMEPCPDMQGHQAKGAPRFLWLGVRSEDPTRPNADLSVCKLNGLHMQVQNLATVMEETKSSWEKIRDGAPDALLFALKGAFEVGTGLDPDRIQKLGKKGYDRLERFKQSPEQKAQRREVSRARDTSLNELVTTMVKGSVSLAKCRPVVIFLDDAQWMDRDLFQFVQDVMKASNCPIHFVATHWTKEWNQGKSSAEDEPPRLGKLGYLSTKTTIQDVKLSEANDDEFRELIRDEFPGLEPDQVDLLIEKSCHNHEVMRMNLVELTKNKHWFEKECLDNKLVRLRSIRDWDPDKKGRFQQVWDSMSNGKQESLCVATVQGARFFRDLVESFLIRFEDDFEFNAPHNAIRALDDAIDPDELIKKHIDTCEFQSTWFRQKASRTRQEKLDKDGELSSLFYTHVIEESIESVCSSFDELLGDFHVIRTSETDSKSTLLNTENIVEVEQKLLLLRTSVRSAEACDLDFRIQVDALWCWLLHHQHRYAELQEEIKSLFTQDFSGVQEQGWLAIACCQKLMETSGLNILYAEVVEPALQAVEMDDHTSHFHVCSALSRALFDLGLFDAARRWNVQAANVLNKMVMSDDVELNVEVAIQFAKICHSTGHYQDGIDRLEVYCPDETCSFDSSNRHFSNALQVVDTLIGLARASGNYDLANQRYRLRIKCYEHASASSDTERHFKGYLQSRWDYARALHEQGQYSQARPEFLSVLDAFDSQSHFLDLQQTLLIEYAQICVADGSVVDAMDLIRRAEVSVESDPQHQADPPSMLRIIDMHRKVAAIESDMGFLQSARSHLQKALDTATALQEKYPLSSHALTLGSCMYELAQSYELAGDDQTALKIYEDATFLAKDHSEGFRDPELKMGYSLSIGNLAEFHKKRGRYGQALKLYKDCVDSCKELSESRPTVELRNQHSTSIRNICKFYESQGQYKQALEWYEKDLRLCKQLSESCRTPEAKIRYSDSLRNLAQFHKDQGDYDNALKRYKECVGSCKDLSESCPTPEAKSQYSVSLGSLAKFHETQGRYGQALEWHKENLKLCKKLSASCPTPEVRILAFTCLLDLANFYKEQGRYDLALKWYKKNFDLAKELSESCPTFLAKSWYSIGLVELAEFYKEQGLYDQALNSYQEYVDSFKELSESCPTSEAKMWYSDSLGNLAQFHEDQGDYDNALKRYKECVDSCKELSESCPTPEARKKYLTSIGNMSEFYRSHGRYDQDLECLKKAYRLSKEFSESCPTPEMRIGYSALCASLGTFHQEQGDYDNALKWYKVCVDTCKELSESCPTSEINTWCAAILAHFARFYDGLGSYDEALNWYRKFVDTCKELSELCPTPEMKIQYSTSLATLAIFHETQGCYSLALECYEEDLRWCKKLSESCPTPEAKTQYSVSLGNLAKFHETQGRYGQALKLYKEFVCLCRELSESCPTPEKWIEYSTSLYNFAKLHEGQGRHGQALEWYEKDLKLCKKISESFPTSQMRKAYSDSLFNLGQFHKEQGRHDEALNRFEESVGSYKQVSESCPSPEMRKVYSDSLGYLAFYHGDQGRHGLAIKRFEEYVDLCKELSKSCPTPEMRMAYSVSLGNFAIFHKEQGRHDKAFKWYEKCVGSYKELSESCPSIEILQRYSTSACSYAEFLSQIERHQQALIVLTDVMQLFEDIASRSDSPKHKYECSTLANQMAQRFIDGGFYHEARAAAMKAFDLRSDLYEIDYRVELRYRMTKSMYWVAFASIKLGDSQKAQHLFTSCVDELLEVMPDLPQVDSVGSVDPCSDFQRIGLAFEEMGDETMVSRIRNILSDHFDVDVDTFDEEEPV